MNDKENILAVVAFDGRDTATDALKVLKQLQKEKKVAIEDVVSVYKDKKGKVKLVQGKELTAGKGATRVGVAGLVAGTLLGGPIAGAAIGALIGGVAGAKKDDGFDNSALMEIGEEIEEDESALFVLLSEMDEDVLENRMEEVGGKVHSFFIAEEGLIALGKITDDEAFLAVLEEEVDVVSVPEE